MAEKRTDSNVYTIIFAVVMVIVVGAILAFIASSLSDRIAENKRIEAQQNILYAMGVNNNGDADVVFISADKAPEAFNKHITKQIIIEGDKIVEDDKAYLTDLKKEQTRATNGETRRLPLMIGEKDGEKFYIVPIRGKGLWDAIWGYVAMDNEMTIKGVFFDHAGETPGLGANINQRFFMDDFKGESLMDKNVFVGIEISKSNNDPRNEDKADNQVDAIAGATITGDGVASMLISELGLYVPYFQKLN